jgi:hypothetical protein
MGFSAVPAAGVCAKLLVVVKPIRQNNRIALKNVVNFIGKNR